MNFKLVIAKEASANFLHAENHSILFITKLSRENDEFIPGTLFDMVQNKLISIVIREDNPEVLSLIRVMII